MIAEKVALVQQPNVQVVFELQQQILLAVVSRSHGAAECFEGVDDGHKSILS